MARPAGRFKQQYTYAALTARDSFGKPTMGAQATAKCRHQPQRGVVRDDHGAEQVFTDILYTEVAHSLNHRVWLPGEDTADFNKARRVLKVSSHVDGEGLAAFRKVFLG